MGEVKEQEFPRVGNQKLDGAKLAYTAGRMARRTLIALILLATPACGGDDAGGPPDSGVTPADAWVELGTGTTAFEELITDGDLVLVAGPQGGHHFIVHARMHGLMPGDPSMPGIVANPSTRFTVWDESGAQIDIAPPPYRLGYEEIEEDVYALASGHIIQVLEEMVPSMYGARVRIAVELTDSTGASVRDERWVTAIEDPNEPDPAWVELGTGVAFQPVAPESDLVLHVGPQGGHHFEVNARMSGFAPGAPGSGCSDQNPTTRFTVWSESGDRLDVNPPICRLPYVAEDDEAFVLETGTIIQVIEAQAEEVYGTRVRIEVELTDTGGLEGTDERWVRVVEP